MYRTKVSVHVAVKVFKMAVGINDQGNRDLSRPKETKIIIIIIIIIS